MCGLAGLSIVNAKPSWGKQDGEQEVEGLAEPDDGGGTTRTRGCHRWLSALTDTVLYRGAVLVP